MSYMTNEEYVRRLGILYQKVLDLRTDDDYVVNQPQMDRLMDVMNFFLDEAGEQDGEVQPVKLIPKREHGGVTATFIVFDIYGDKIQRFCDVMRFTSAISIHSIGEDGICISCTVPNVFVHK